LQDIRDNFAKLIGQGKDLSELTNNALSASQEALRASQQQIFIALYSSEGSNLQSWERILANLPRQLISRPIYTDEESVQSLIRSKENKVNEAYVVAYISQADILNLAAEKIPIDKFGKSLLSIKDRSLSLDNVTRFVHLSGTYRYLKGRLVKES
jgi:intracellular multiplication protein IcmQ